MTSSLFSSSIDESTPAGEPVAELAPEVLIVPIGEAEAAHEPADAGADSEVAPAAEGEAWSASEGPPLEVAAGAEAVVETAPLPVIPIEAAVPSIVPSLESTPVAAFMTATPEQAPVAAAAVAEPDESFGDLLSQFERSHPRQSEDGSKQIDATVVSVTAESVFLDIGFKTEGVLPIAAFAGAKEPVKAGDKSWVTIKGRNEEGYYELSLLKLAQPKDWSSLEAAFAEKATVVGTVTGVVKGGLTVDVGVRAFMPASRSGVRDAGAMEKLVGHEIRCRIIKLDVEDEDVVVDRRAIAEEEERSTKERRYSEVREGDIVSGEVRSLTDYGAFVDLGGVDALLHISDIAWTRIAKPADVLSVGQQVEAKVLKVEPEKRRISIGLKQLQAHPWDGVAAKFTVGERVTGVVTRLTDFGAFVEIAAGIEGLVHVSEMSWAKKVRKPSDMVKTGDTVEVMVLSIAPTERRISLGLKQALGDPWVAAGDKLAVGAIIEGPVTSFTKFGAFVQVADGIEGMVHISEIVPDKRINHPQDELHLGQVVKALVLESDKEKRQLKLSIKQLVPTGLDEYLAEHAVGDVVSGRIIEATGDKLVVELGEGIRVVSKLPAAVAAPPAVVAAPKAEGKADLSALSSMLKAKWKSGPADVPITKKSVGVRAGEIRSFRITRIDPAAKTIEVEPA